MSFAAAPRVSCRALVLAVNAACVGCQQRSSDDTSAVSAPATSNATIRDDVPHPGGRLRLQADDHGEPSEIGAAWDTELSIRCTVHVGTYGRLHCLPDPFDPDVHEVFLDGRCTPPVIETCSRDAKLASQEDTSSEQRSSGTARIVAGEGRSRLYGLYPHPSHVVDAFYAIAGQSIESPVQRYQLDDKERCEPVRGSRGICDHRSVERKLDQKDFVAFSDPVPTGPESSRLRPRFVDGEDGTRLLYDFWDTELEIPCRFARPDSGPDRCFPYRPDDRVLRTYVDPYCQERGVYLCTLLDNEPTVVPISMDADPAVAPTRFEFALLDTTLGGSDLVPAALSKTQRVQQ